MCHSDESRPPAAPGAGPAGASGALTLTAADGTRVLAHATRAGTPRGVGVVVLPDVRGLHDYYRRLTVRLAEVGLDAVAIDYFGRTAGTDDRGEGFDYMPHVRRVRPATVALDVAAAVAYLRSPAGGGTRSVFTLGFCFGGGQSWRQAAAQPGLAGAIGFYGFPASAMEASDRLAAPILALYAGADRGVALADVEALARTVRSRGLDADVVVLDGMPHSFFDRSFAEHAEACERSWREVLRFVDAHAGGGAG